MPHGVKPKKHLGQHFLKNTEAAVRMAEAAAAIAADGVVEIGAGEGALTEHLLPHFPQLLVVEIDTESLPVLQRRFDLGPRLVHGDFLRWPFPEGRWLVVGNFPYQISTQIVFRILENRSSVAGMVGMFQKEVAERLCAPPGHSARGILSVLVEGYFHASYLFTLAEHDFIPPPKVKSGVVMFVPKPAVDLNPDEEKRVWTVVKMAFNQRRKMLRNSLRALLPDEPDEWLTSVLDKRPETLDFNQFVTLSRMLKA